MIRNHSVLGSLFVVLLLLVSACSAPPPTQNWVKGETGTVSRIVDGDTLVLTGGQVVRLVSIEAPSPAYRDRAEAPHAEKSKRMLERLVLGRDVQLYYPGITRDRYERALAHVYAQTETGKDIWVNASMVAQGGAYVRIYPDTERGSERLWPLERTAREEETGLWRLRDYAPIQREVEPTETGFMLLWDRPVRQSFEDGRCKWQLVWRGLEAVLNATNSGACQSPADLAEWRGFVREGRLYISSVQNIRPIAPDPPPSESD